MQHIIRKKSKRHPSFKLDLVDNHQGKHVAINSSYSGPSMHGHFFAMRFCHSSHTAVEFLCSPVTCLGTYFDKSNVMEFRSIYTVGESGFLFLAFDSQPGYVISMARS